MILDNDVDAFSSDAILITITITVSGFSSTYFFVTARTVIVEDADDCYFRFF